MDKESTVEVLLADLMLRLNTLEKILIEKKIINQEEYIQELDALAKNVAQVVLDKANVSKDLGEFIDNLEKGN